MRWHVDVQLDVRDGPAPADFNTETDSRFHIEIYSEEWGFFFCHRGRASWIRVTDIPFIHVRDDYNLLAATPTLDNVGELLRSIELEHELHFRREQARIRTNLTGIDTAVRRWIRSL